MSTDDNDAYGALDKSNLKFIYEQFLSKKGVKAMKVLSEKELAELLHISKWTVRSWRLKGGLPFIQVGRRIFYQMESVQRWMNEVEVRNNLSATPQYVSIV